MNFDDILQDPELATEFVLIRSTETVNDSGRAEREETESNLTGVILPATEKQLERLPEEHRNSEVIAVYCPHQITSGSPTLAPDRVTWRGEAFEVVQVKDFMQAAGYCEALAKSTTPLGREVEA
jgi:hypothetical protein